MKKPSTSRMMLKLGSGGNTDVYAVEREPRWYAPFWRKTAQKWHASIPVSYPMLPPTLADVDSDGLKEVLVGLRNGTLIAYDVSSSGKSATEKWRYKFPEKYSTLAGESLIDFGGGSAVVDIDLDGTPEVITVDYLVVQNSPQKRWLINYVTTGESYLNAQNLSSTVYLLEIADKTTAQITNEVSTFINSTKN